MGACVHATSNVRGFTPEGWYWLLRKPPRGGIGCCANWVRMSQSITRLTPLPQRLETRGKCLLLRDFLSYQRASFIRHTWPILSPAINDGAPRNDSCIDGLRQCLMKKWWYIERP